MKTPRRSTNWASSGNGFGFKTPPSGVGMGSRVGHVPVLLKEAIDFLAVKRGGTYLDATVGLGGHSCEIAKRLGAPGHLIGFDKDPAALETRPRSIAAIVDRSVGDRATRDADEATGRQ